MARQGKVNGKAPHGSTFIKQNGVLGVAGHFISTIDVDQALYQLLGAPVIRGKKKCLQPTRIQTTVVK